MDRNNNTTNNNNNNNNDYEDIISNLLNTFSNQVNNLSNNTHRPDNLTQTDTLFESVLNSRNGGNNDIRATANETTPLRATQSSAE